MKKVYHTSHNVHLSREARQRSETGNEGTRTRLKMKSIMILMVMVVKMVIMILIMMMMIVVDLLVPDVDCSCK